MEFLSSIEKELSHIQYRIDVQREPIDHYLKEQIIHVLETYSLQASGKSISKKKQIQLDKIKNMIQEVSFKIEKLPSVKTFLEHELKNKKKEEIDQMKDKLKAVEKTFKKSNFYLEDCIYWAQCIENFNPAKPYVYSKTLVNLFLYTAPKPISNSLNSFLLNLKKIYNYISAVTFTVMPSLIEKNKIIDILQIIQSLINGISNITTKTLKKLTENPEEALKKISEQLNDYDDNLHKMKFPISSATVEDYTKQLAFFRNQLTEISTENKEIEEKKIKEIAKTNQIFENLTQLIDCYEFLVNIEKRIFETARSFINFEIKIKNLKSMLKQIQKIDIYNEVLQNEKQKLILTTSALIASETLNYLKQKLEIADNFKCYAERFSFPRTNKMYEIKIKEMHDLKNTLSCVPQDYALYQNKIAIIEERITEALKILEAKAIENEETLSNLKKLEIMQNEIKDCKEINLECCNIYRNKIQNIDNFTNRFINKKMEGLKQIHQWELEIYEKYFPQCTPVISKLLKKYQLLTQKTIYCDINDINYELEINEIKYLFGEFQNLISVSHLQENNNFIKYLQNFYNEFKLLLEKMKNVLDQFNELGNVEAKFNSNETKKEDKDLINLLDQLQPLEKNYIRNNFKLKVLNVKRKIIIEQLKRKIENYYHSDITTFSINENNITMDKIYQLLEIKEKLDDMLEGYSELNSMKESALTKLKEILKSVNPTLADLVFTYKEMQTINPETYFTDIENIPIANKESSEYIQYIHDQAKILENDVEDFLGTKDSMDFYIIGEKLMRLLEKLDSVKTNDEQLTDKIVETMFYIKQLKKTLTSYTCLK